METSGKSSTTVECPCGWSRHPSPGEDTVEALRYHRIQVHNDLEAVHNNVRF